MSVLNVTQAYDPLACKLVIAGKTMSGYMDGTKISIEKNSDFSGMKVGTDGDVGFYMDRNETGTLTFTLQQVAQDMLSFLTKLQLAQKTTRAIAVPISFKDPTGLALPTVCMASIKRIGTYTVSNEISGVEVSLNITHADMVADTATGLIASALTAVSSIL